MALWCEQAGQNIAVLPLVRNELLQRGVRTGRSAAVRIDAWNALLEQPQTPYRMVSLDAPDVDLYEQVLRPSRHLIGRAVSAMFALLPTLVP